MPCKEEVDEVKTKDEIQPSSYTFILHLILHPK